MRETEILKEIQTAFPYYGGRLLRNNVGRLRDVRGNYVQYGLGVGSSDLIGWLPVDISGEKRAIFVALEVKTEKTFPTLGQRQFIQAVKDAGGIAGIVRSTQDVRELIDSYL